MGLHGIATNQLMAGWRTGLQASIADHHYSSNAPVLPLQWLFSHWWRLIFPHHFLRYPFIITVVSNKVPTSMRLQYCQTVALTFFSIIFLPPPTSIKPSGSIAAPTTACFTSLPSNDQCVASSRIPGMKQGNTIIYRWRHLLNIWLLFQITECWWFSM